MWNYHVLRVGLEHALALPCTPHPPSLPRRSFCSIGLISCNQFRFVALPDTHRLPSNYFPFPTGGLRPGPHTGAGPAAALSLGWHKALSCHVELPCGALARCAELACHTRLAASPKPKWAVT